jgi:hypothetical protein
MPWYPLNASGVLNCVGFLEVPQRALHVAHPRLTITRFVHVSTVFWPNPKRPKPESRSQVPVSIPPPAMTVGLPL